MMDKPDDATRRIALKGFAAAAITTTAAALGTGTAYARRREQPELVRGRVLVYRLRSRKTRACNACQEHHKYIVCRTRHAMDNNRAHKGCNCEIVMQAIRLSQFQELFPDDSDVVARLPRDYNL